MHIVKQRMRLSTSEDFPILFWEDSFMPARLPLLYLMLARRKYPYDTMELDARVLLWLYNWCYDVAHIDLETRLSTGDTLSQHELQGFSRWLQFKRTASNVVAVIGTVTAEVEETTYLSPATHDKYMSCLKSFLLWAAEHFIPLNYPAIETRAAFADVEARLNLRMKHLFIGGKSEDLGRGLTEAQSKRLLQVAHSDSPENPFIKQNRVRNYTIVRIFLDAGIRRGELGNLRTADRPMAHAGNWLNIEARDDDPVDTRGRRPKVKTRNRRIQLLPEHSRLCQQYMDEHRWVVRDGKRKKPNHPFLFISSTGEPLCLDAINDILETLKKVCFPGENVDCRPHILRNTFCNRFMEHAVEVLGKGLDEAKDELRVLCGWSETSTMPSLYAKKWMQGAANTANATRLKAEYKGDQD